MASKLDKMRQTHADNMLTENELEQAAGGSFAETIDDSKFLNKLMEGMPGQPPRQNSSYELDRDGGAAVQTAWEKLGITFRYGIYAKPNEYYLDGKKLSRAEAMNYAQQRVGKQLTDSEWKY